MEIKHLSLGMVNTYLIKNRNDLFLVDTGLAMNRAKLEKLLTKEGIKPGDIKMVFLTHGDMDHTGNGAFFQKSGAKIAIHSEDADMCRTGKSNPNRKRKGSPFSKLTHKIMFKVLFPRLMKRHPFETFEPDIILSEGQDLKDYGFDAKVFHIPGHTKGSIGILTSDHDFFSGDTMNNRKKPETANIIEDETALAQSLEKIRKLDINNVYPGHGTPFKMTNLQL